MTPIGEAISDVLKYDDHGGACVRDGCTNDAPRVQLFGNVVKLPCRSHAAEEKAAADAEDLAQRATVYLAQSGATPRIAAWSLDTYAQACDDDAGRAALAVARDWLASFYTAARRSDELAARYVDQPWRANVGVSGISNLLLFGAVGAGKTGLAWGIVRDLCEHGYEAKIVTFRNLLEEMKDAYAERVSTAKWLKTYFDARVVAFDDLGSEVPTDWARNQLLGLVDARYERGLASIFISNYSPGDLARRLSRDDPIIGTRILSRMSEGAVQHRIKHSDRRMAA